MKTLKKLRQEDWNNAKIILPNGIETTLGEILDKYNSKILQYLKNVPILNKMIKEINLSTDQEDGNLYFEVSGIDISFEGWLEEQLKQHPKTKKFWNEREQCWYSRIPKTKIKISIEI